MNVFLKIIYVILGTFLTAILVTLFAAKFLKKGSGWEDIGMVLGALIIGCLLGLLITLLSMNRVSADKLKLFVPILAIIDAFLGFYLFI